MNLPDLTMPKFDAERFFKEFWRTKPLFVPQGAKFFLEKTHDYEWFEQVKKSMSQSKDNIFEHKGVVSFIERISEHDTHLGEQAALMRSKFNFPACWFDAIQTDKPTNAGIGTHFDHSDNFILQQQGTKYWQLASEKYIPNELKAKRMLLHNQSGDFYFPKNCETVNFVLNPGDLLYIPLNWIHDGHSNSPSLSISLVCPAIPFHSLILQLAEAAKVAGTGYQPIPLLHPWLTEQEKNQTNALCSKVLKHMLNHLNENLVEKMIANILKKNS